MLRLQLSSRPKVPPEGTGSMDQIHRRGNLRLFCLQCATAGKSLPFRYRFGYGPAGRAIHRSCSRRNARICVLGSFENNLPYLIALLGVLAFKLALAGHSKLRNNTGLLCGFTAAILSVTLTVSNTLSGASTVGILLGLAESLLGGAMTWFCIYGIKALENFTPGERTKSK